MPLSSAGQAEIIRSHQKDDLYLNYLRSTVAEVTQRLFGARNWLSWRAELDLLADLGYFLLTTFAGYQTLGEEYVNTIQVDPSRRVVPSKLRRFIMILCHIGGWYGLKKSFDWLEKKLRSGAFPEMPSTTREFLLKCLPVVQHVVTIAHRCHLAVFYLNGTYYHIAKRLAGVQYLQYHAGSINSSNRPSFHLLGWLSLIQVCGSLSVEAFRFIQRHLKGDRKKGDNLEQHEDNSEERLQAEYVPDWKKCCLCLEGRKDATATPCGHLFCWHCIHEWCQTKTECPLCREKFSPSRLIHLQNYT